MPFGQSAGAVRQRLRRNSAGVSHSAVPASPAAGAEPARPAPLLTASTASLLRLALDSAGLPEALQSPPPSVAGKEPAAASTPTHEYYGFVLYLVSLAAFAVYLLWAYLPDEALEAVGITYYPDRYWAVALPAWWLVAVASVYVFNLALNLYNTPLLSSMDNITDSFANLPGRDCAADCFCYDEVGGIPPVGDIPISLVNQCLYQQ
ncbi:hypothetical protein IWQ57_003738 [Coemansia nantahalensis]|uniref:Uncharacterized protein n=1 Tax=Coemansia nantahalensis TaxID=2789366 RepID=A0ACC1JVM3_9FUNG|nr:hypothetical protein IWQ57_003738 [Coemansia nantahalensis]